MQFIKKDSRRVPHHWHTFNQRVSRLSLSPRRAINPANALLNYLYAILEVESTLALHKVGLDPSLGVLHADQRGRDSFSLDLMEAVRPDVDEFVLKTLSEHRFCKADFFETTDGGCRILPPLTEKLTETAQKWAEVVAPYAEQTAQFLMDATTEDRPVRLATPLTQSNRSEGRGPLRGGKTVSTKKPCLQLPRCQACGLSLSSPDRTYCDECLPERRSEQLGEFASAGHERLKKLRAAKRDPAHNEQANQQRKLTQEQHLARRARWEALGGEEVDPEVFKHKILPGLKALSLRKIRERTGFSLRYCSLIRSGEQVPHASHWQALGELAEADLSSIHPQVHFD
jgi:hypothetical protein